MNSNDIGPSVGKGGNVFIYIFDHQVHVQLETGMLFKRLNDFWTNGNIGHKVTIHHIQVQVLNFGKVYFGCFFNKLPVISR